MPTVHELYELWAADSELRDALTRSLDPRGPDWLLDAFGSLGPQRDDVLVDVGARDGKHSAELARRHGVRVVALDPMPQHPDVLEGTAEELPFDDGEVDWIWCRDVLSHVDVPRTLAEFARVLRPGGAAGARSTAGRRPDPSGRSRPSPRATPSRAAPPSARRGPPRAPPSRSPRR